MKIIVQKLAIEYEDDGNGPVLLFLHGWQDNLHTFDLLVEILKREYRIIRLDLPGFGKSDTPKETWNLAHYVDFVLDFIKKTNLSVYALIGHSFGGRILIKGSLQNKLSADKLIFIASAGISNKESFKSKTMHLCAKIIKPILYIPPFSFFRDKIRYTFYTNIKSDYLNAGTLQATFVEVINEDLQNCAKNITVPTLLIYGRNDDSTPVSFGEKLAKNIESSKLQIIEDSGHFVHREKTDEVGELIHNFLK